MASILSLVPLAVMAAPQFDNPALRGAPFETEYSYIPEIYVGEWAEKLSACSKTKRQDRTLTIETTRLNGAPYHSVWAYSDYPAIIVVSSDDKAGVRGERLHLDISYDEMWLKFGHEGGGESRLLRRCPVHAGLKQAGKVERERVADACARRDREGFIDVFFGSPAARYQALSNQITIIRGDAPAKFWPRRYYRLPPIKFAPHIAYYEYGPERTMPLKFEPTADPDGGFRIEWREDSSLDVDRIDGYPSQPRYPSGIRGRLSFSWSNDCWKLVSDEIRWSDWP